MLRHSQALPAALAAGRFICVLGALLCAGAPAVAHVSLEWPQAVAGRGYKATLRIGHGCAGAPTRQVVAEIPAGVRGARPMPKPGWDVRVERQPLAQPYESHGKRVTEDVVRITWTARTEADMLPDGFYDEFALWATLPGQAGTLWWPVRQVCTQGRHDWTEVPGPGQRAHDLKSPAAMLELMPAAGAAAHAH